MSSHNNSVRQAFLFQTFRDEDTDSGREVKYLIQDYQQSKDMNQTLSDFMAKLLNLV